MTSSSPADSWVAKQMCCELPAPMARGRLQVFRNNSHTPGYEPLLGAQEPRVGFWSNLHRTARSGRVSPGAWLHRSVVLACFLRWPLAAVVFDGRAVGICAMLASGLPAPRGNAEIQLESVFGWEAQRGVVSPNLERCNVGINSWETVIQDRPKWRESRLQGLNQESSTTHSRWKHVP